MQTLPLITQVHPLNTEAYEEWRQWRQSEKKVKIGPIAEKKQVKFLTQYSPVIQAHIIDTSIANSYQGLFPPKPGSIPTQPQDYSALAAGAVDLREFI